MDEKKIMISGGAGQIAYSLIPLICSGEVFGKNIKLNIKLYDILSMEDKLDGVKMEIDDSCYPLVNSVTTTVDGEVAFSDVDYVILLGGFPRKPGMLRSDLIEKNVKIFKTAGQLLEKFSPKHVKVLVVANPANTNAAICMKNAPRIPRTSFTCLMMLDHDRLRNALAEKLILHRDILKLSSNFTILNVKNVIIWGNHSQTMVPDISHVQIFIKNNWINLFDIKNINNILTDEWIDELTNFIRQRGKSVISKRQLSSAMSAAQSIAKHIRIWHNGTLDNEFVSMGICSDNEYNLPNDLIFSLPVEIKNGKIYTVKFHTVRNSFNLKIQTNFKKSLEELKNEYKISNSFS